MSVFASDERILIEEIVETTTEDQEPEIFGSETLDESGIAAVALVEVTDTQDQDPLDTEGLELEEYKDIIEHEKINHRSGKNSGGSNGNRGTSQNNTFGSGSDTGNVGRVTQRTHMEQEKRMRREIANSNERRRMQSINAGFQSLRTLLPHHEGEKLSKAAILQQTAEYIYQLEQEKTQLLSQNCQLKRLVNQHEGGDVPIKKRKAESQGVVVSLPMHVNESGDEGLGSMSPEPLSVITVSADNHTVVNNSSTSINSEIAELRRQLERERHQRLHLEKQLRGYQTQVYPERFRDNQLLTYQPHEVIEHTDNVMAQETEEAVTALQVVSVMSIPAVGSTQTVETTSPEPSSPPLSPQSNELITDEIKDDDTRPGSPKIVTFTANNQLFTATIEEQTNNEAFSPTRVTYAGEFKNSGAQFIAASPTRPFSPINEPRLPSVLEAAMKAEPKVEVERLPSPSTSLEDGTPQGRHYLANTSRQNLETIVEAIRHLEGDHLFSDEPAQDVPLALTNKPTGTNPSTFTKQRLLQHADVNFLHLHTQQPNQQRPGVIVVKHS